MFIENFKVGDLIFRKFQEKITYGILSEICEETLSFSFDNGTFWEVKSLPKNYEIVANESFEIINTAESCVKKNIDKDYKIGDGIFLNKKCQQYSIYMAYMNFLKNSPYFFFNYFNEVPIFFGKILRFTNHGVVLKCHNHVTGETTDKELFIPNIDMNDSKIIDNFEISYVLNSFKITNIVPGNKVFDGRVLIVKKIKYSLINPGNKLLFCRLEGSNEEIVIKHSCVTLLEENNVIIKNSVKRVKNKENYLYYYWTKNGDEIYGLINDDFRNSPYISLELII